MRSQLARLYSHGHMHPLGSLGNTDFVPDSHVSTHISGFLFLGEKESGKQRLTSSFQHRNASSVMSLFQSNSARPATPFVWLGFPNALMVQEGCSERVTGSKGSLGQRAFPRSGSWIALRTLVPVRPQVMFKGAYSKHPDRISPFTSCPCKSRRGAPW